MTHTMATQTLYQHPDKDILIHVRFEGGLIGHEARNARSVLLIEGPGIAFEISTPEMAGIVTGFSQPGMDPLFNSAILAISQWAHDETKRRETPALDAQVLSPLPTEPMEDRFDLAPPENQLTREDAWLIWCDRDQGWWRPDNKGYTNNILSAGIYTEQYAKHCAESREFDYAKKLTDALHGRGEKTDNSVGKLLGVLA